MANIDLYSTCTVVFLYTFNDLLRYTSVGIELKIFTAE